ncbi:hypothetical protein DEAC_c00290 [Desulfosporosinus acididurans]|uniref:Uncharacterized protein n=1 Tax=Desulfosporosinus acididurans TaxID=476652 RepID=A0A0J1FW30_9FIRM|nr:hypothetical protein [Desulfosporosinus acididurans]KLU67635.1 hypothetical protein DEAC_c00290 [Desulfosporosinus acididurans]
MQKLNKKISMLFGTTVLAIGLFAIPALAGTMTQRVVNQVSNNQTPAWSMPYGYGMNGYGGYGSNDSNNGNGYGYGYGMMSGYSGNGRTGSYGMMGGYGENGGTGSYGMMGGY